VVVEKRLIVHSSAFSKQMKQKPKDFFRILVACEPWFGSTGWGAIGGFRRLGHEVLCVNYREVIPKVTTVRLKLLRRLLLRWFVLDIHFEKDLMGR
jgi:hypothetical protein